jgi:hypothetical protein
MIFDISILASSYAEVLNSMTKFLPGFISNFKCSLSHEVNFLSRALDLFRVHVYKHVCSGTTTGGHVKVSSGDCFPKSCS